MASFFGLSALFKDSSFRLQTVCGIYRLKLLANACLGLESVRVFEPERDTAVHRERRQRKRNTDRRRENA